jgi:hypothetical protein
MRLESNFCSSFCLNQLTKNQPDWSYNILKQGLGKTIKNNLRISNPWTHEIKKDCEAQNVGR